ncbi:hypothetical protein [Micromonospora sp. WMMD987]|uniref:hypothetical protein n=1 Tax=Micromonospora sp. WMMD987 TaxID=3016089 RepID=UPI00249B685B|nr:hypothetical protein [Micromonospora sp. WMMD987]WFE95937.1 hypothetical protein O7612_03130 [Micromonospora sp. WMMD987]
MAAPTAQVTRRPASLDMREVGLKLSKWFLFEVVFALVPLGFNWLGSILHGGGSGINVILGRGELLLVSTAIVAASLGDLVNKGLNPQLRGFKQLLVGVGIFLIVAATWLYAEAAATPGEAATVDLGLVVTLSLTVALVAIILSMACLVVAEVK